MITQKEIKKYDPIQTAKKAYSLIISSQYSVEEVAWYLGITDRTIYYWGEGKRAPSTQNLYALSQLFEISIESILV